MKRFKPSTHYDMAKGIFVTSEPTSRPKRKKTKTPTNSLTDQIMKYVQLRGGYAMRINVSGFYRENVGYIKSGSTLGVPDLMAVFEGLFIGIEVKTGVDTQSNKQKVVQERIQAAKGVYLLASDFDSFRADFDAVLSRL